MNYNDVVTRSLYDSRDEKIVAPDLLTGDEPIPAWWAEVTGPNGGTLLANKWDELASAELFPQTKTLLRSKHTLGVAIVRSYPGSTPPARWNLVVALDHGPSVDASDGPITVRLDVPLDAKLTPPWWSFFPPALREFYLRAHRDIGEGVLANPSGAGVVLASHRFDLDDPEDLCAFQTMPDPRELVLVAAPGEDQLYLDIGQRTYQGWEVPGIHDLVGGPRPVDLLETIDAYIVDDYSSQKDLPETDASQAIYPPPLRPRTPELDWPTDPFWQSLR